MLRAVRGSLCVPVSAWINGGWRVGESSDACGCVIAVRTHAKAGAGSWIPISAGRLAMSAVGNAGVVTT